MAKQQKGARTREEELAVEALFRSNVANIVPVDLEKEMRTSFIDYAMSVITDRALPDVRDGLKPVHRRILYSMFTQGFTPDKAYRKCATTVGDVLGRFHPHGDQAVYDAMVRLAQDFSMRHMLVDGHGNFGSRDGDPAAAYRYTEARLSKIAMEMMGDINKKTVDFQPNFDEHELEPIVLPAHFPSMLVNGSTGIAVGMATNIPPHNLSETIDGAIYLMRHPDADINDLIERIPGPDFPTGGTIMGTSGIRAAYTTGRGQITVRASCEIEDLSGGRQCIIVHDLPYMVNKANLIEKIAECVKDKRIDGISFVRDESDRNEAVRIVIELKRDANAAVVLNQLYRMTGMQQNFNANILALVPEQGAMVPRVINLMSALHYFNDHQKEVVRRRTQHDLEKAENRRHIVEGLLKAIDNIDEVIRVIRSSRNEEVAKERLSERFGFSDSQAQHIVNMRLGRLSAMEREKLENEHAELLRQIEGFRAILADEQLLIEVIVEEMTALKEKYGDERRTAIDPYGEELTDESLIKEETVVITMTDRGYVKRQPVDIYSMQHRGGKGVMALQMREDDVVRQIVTTSTHDWLLFFTNTGRVFRLKGYQIPEESRQAKGLPLVNLLQLNEGESIRTIVPVSVDLAEGYITFATALGLVKRTPLADFSNINRSGLIAISLRDGDALIGAELTSGLDHMLLISRNGLSIRFAETDCRSMGRNTMGVKGIQLAAGDVVIRLVKVPAGDSLPESALDAEAESEPETDSGDENPLSDLAATGPMVLLVSANGFGKRTPFGEFRIQRRGGKGLIAYKPNPKTGELVAAFPVTDTDDALLINDTGSIIRIQVSEVSILRRPAIGVRVMRSASGQVVDVAVVPHEDAGELPEDLPSDDSADESAANLEPAATDRAVEGQVPEA